VAVLDSPECLWRWLIVADDAFVAHQEVGEEAVVRLSRKPSAPPTLDSMW
jgi:hypothetical protein